MYSSSSGGASCHKGRIQIAYFWPLLAKRPFFSKLMYTQLGFAAQLFEWLKTEYQPFSTFKGHKGKIWISYFWPLSAQRLLILKADICSSVSPCLRQLFGGLKTEYQPFSAFKGHQGRIRIAYSVLSDMKALTFNQLFWLKWVVSEITPWLPGNIQTEIKV